MTKLIKFSTEDCGYCKMVDGFLSDKNIEVSETINPFENPEIAGKYEVCSIPVTILLDDNNNEVSRSNGFKPNELELLISQL